MEVKVLKKMSEQFLVQSSSTRGAYAIRRDSVGVEQEERITLNTKS